MKSGELSLTSLTDVLTDLVKGVVTQPDKVKVTNLDRGSLVAFVIKTEQDDVRKVLGKRGKHFKAMEVIVTEALRTQGKETHVAIDEKRYVPGAVAPRSPNLLGTYSAKKFKDVKDTLKSVVELFAEDGKPTIVQTDLGASGVLLEIHVAPTDFPRLYGRLTEFEYGSDGHIIGSIKNIFDGIGKNNGRIVRIALIQKKD